ncbi:hypothetical protein ACFYY8_29185 [Streptosporangium sp. NPDC001559]|uniref:hypothetical protein n=1 Tax=Streptosporangium sp. NPDC001559 TaxID=3366187 RepID=UPI0036E039CE
MILDHATAAFTNDAHTPVAEEPQEQESAAPRILQILESGVSVTGSELLRYMYSSMET